MLSDSKSKSPDLPTASRYRVLGWLSLWFRLAGYLTLVLAFVTLILGIIGAFQLTTSTANLAGVPLVTLRASIISTAIGAFFSIITIGLFQVALGELIRAVIDMSVSSQVSAVILQNTIGQQANGASFPPDAINALKSVSENTRRTAEAIEQVMRPRPTTKQ